MESDWIAVAESLLASQKASGVDLNEARRDFMRQVGLDARTIRRNRLRPQDGLSEDAWWVAVRQAMKGRRNAT